MCGIIGYVGDKPALPIILDGLRRLEYRGYDSFGAAVIEPSGSMHIRKEAGRLTAEHFDVQSMGSLGIGHTRWATHGKPTTRNAHPHTDTDEQIAVAHNGIVENHAELRRKLEQAGHVFRSQTDTEVIPHLIARHLAQGATLEEAVRQSASLIAGAQAFVVISRKEPDKIVGVRIGHAGGMAVGYGAGAMLLASDLPAILSHAESASYLGDREMATITRGTARFQSLGGGPLAKEKLPVLQEPATVAKGPYKHFMLKEIMEQPETLISALRDRLDFSEGRVMLPDFPFNREQVRGFTRVVLLGMGTSFHSAVVGRHMIETLARVPCYAENASEFRYLDPVVGPETLVVSVTQSGETVDTLAAMVEARQKGAPQITVCNVAGSEATRIAEYTMLINAGPEIGVASTKTMTGSMLCLYLLAIHLGQIRNTLGEDTVRELLDEVVRLPELMGKVLAGALEYEPLARKYSQSLNFLLLGRGVNHPMALEGALKMKEISYIHAEGYQAGEFKHGPIALVDENMPVVAIALRDKMYDKIMSNIEEVKARDGRIIAIATQGDEEVAARADDVISVPDVSYLVSPILTVAPMQLLAYHIAVRRGADVDQPRNLAKTVTVE